MTSMVAVMPSSVDSGSTNRYDSPEAGPRGFTAINITPPHSRGMHEHKAPSHNTNGLPESSATSPDVSPKHGNLDVSERQGDIPRYYTSSADRGHEYKRRKSLSPEQDAHLAPRYDYHPPPKRAEDQQHQHLADKALHVLDSKTTDNRGYYYNAKTVQQSNYSQPYERNNLDPNPATISQPYPNSVNQFCRESSEPQDENSMTDFDPNRPEDDSTNMSVSGQTGRKRKRAFTNRTKTGCKTCRSRKKKCDEGRPVCNNCQKGGFQCGGYDLVRSEKDGSSKSTPLKQPILLHSKEEDDAKGTPTPASAIPYYDDDHLQDHVAGHGQVQSRPHYTVDSTSSAETRPPPKHQPRWSPPQQPPQTYSTDHLPPLNEVQRLDTQQPPRSTYSAISQRDMSGPTNQPHSVPPMSAVPGGSTWPTHPHPQQQQSTQSAFQPPPVPHQHQHQQQQQQYGSRQAPYPPPIDTTQLSHPAHHRLQTASTATTASASYSSYEQKSGSKVFLNEDVERSRMLRGAPYNYFDSTLENERIRCNNALIRYNKLCKIVGSSKNEKQTRLQEVFDPKKDDTYNPSAPCRMEGHLGPGVKIEAGFDCTYGYNIRISDNAFVGKNTRIDDSAKVEIGARCWISANVTILTNDVVKELVQRKGADGQPNIAHPVWIGTEVVIGTGAVILPGVRVGRGCTIEPFAVVKTNLPDFTTVPSPSSVSMQSGAY